MEVSAEIGQTRKRVHAIVRCLADLGMRSIEITRLTLIYHRLGERADIRVPSTKSRRSDPMPLPFATGEAIADYIVHERQATQHREVFVRHVAPIGEPITPRAVQRSVYAVYERLGWDCTRIHIFRHTIASRLVNGVVPMKQVADVMRHRSVVTTAGYARGSKQAGGRGPAVAGSKGMTGSTTMLSRAETYLAYRRNLGFKLKNCGEADHLLCPVCRDDRGHEGTLSP